jgi:hypothetical protein
VICVARPESSKGVPDVRHALRRLRTCHAQWVIPRPERERAGHRIVAGSCCLCWKSSTINCCRFSTWSWSWTCCRPCSR